MKENNHSAAAIILHVPPATYTIHHTCNSQLTVQHRSVIKDGTQEDSPGQSVSVTIYLPCHVAGPTKNLSPHKAILLNLQSVF